MLVQRQRGGMVREESQMNAAQTGREVCVYGGGRRAEDGKRARGVSEATRRGGPTRRRAGSRVEAFASECVILD